MSQPPTDTVRLKVRAALFSVISNTSLVTMKLVVGLVGGSVSIISEAIHSAVDLLASLVAWFSVRMSGKPADEEHPFGHGKYENVSGAVEAVLIFVAAAWIAREAVGKLLHPEPVEFVGLGCAVMAVSVVMNTVISRYLLRVARQTDSVALKADAWHLLTDVYTSVGVLVGLGAILVGRVFVPGLNLQWVDPVAALFVAGLIVKAAWDLTVESVRDLLDVRLCREDESWIREYLTSRRPVVRGFHGLRTRKAGASRFVEFHLIVDKEMHVSEAHRISEDVERAISSHLKGAFVNVHVEPCEGDCRKICLEGCLVPEHDRPAKPAAG